MKIWKKTISLVLAFICTAFVLTTAACTDNREITFRLLRDTYELEAGESADIEMELTQNGEALPTDAVRYASSDESIGSNIRHTDLL